MAYIQRRRRSRLSSIRRPSLGARGKDANDGEVHTVTNMRSWRATCAAAVLLGVAGASSAHAKLRRPAQQSPAASATVEVPPPLTLTTVKGADHYEVQVAANQSFTSPTVSFGNNAALVTKNTAATPTKAWPDGTYYWRVRAVSPADAVGSWSPARRLVKAWETAPLVQGGDNLAVNWPLTPLELKWSIVPHAQKYFVTVATDDDNSNVVLGERHQARRDLRQRVGYPLVAGAWRLLVGGHAG